VHIAPFALEAAALFAVMSRLKPSSGGRAEGALLQQRWSGRAGGVEVMLEGREKGEGLTGASRAS
jgi:hypothetical protein